MKIKLSKSQWEQIGKTAGWTNQNQVLYTLTYENEVLASVLMPEDATDEEIRAKVLDDEKVLRNGTDVYIPDATITPAPAVAPPIEDKGNDYDLRNKPISIF